MFLQLKKKNFLREIYENLVNSKFSLEFNLEDLSYP